MAGRAASCQVPSGPFLACSSSALNDIDTDCGATAGVAAAAGVAAPLDPIGIVDTEPAVGAALAGVPAELLLRATNEMMIAQTESRAVRPSPIASHSCQERFCVVSPPSDVG